MSDISGSIRLGPTIHETQDYINQLENMVAERDALVARLRAIIQAAPDPAFYKPDELAGAWEKWHSAVLRGGVR